MSTASRGLIRRLRSIDRSLWVLLGVVIVSSVGSGMPWYTMGVLFKPLTEHFGWGYGAYSVAQSLFMLSLNLSSLPIGGLVDRWGSRRVMAIMGVLSCVLWLLISQVGRVGGASAALIQLYVLYVLLGISSSGLGNVPCNALVARWFRKRRGLAMGVAMIGGSLPGVILVPLSAPFIDAYGWRGLTMLLGVIVLVGSVPTIIWAIRDPPAGAESDTKTPSAVKSTSNGSDYTARQALRQGSFWVIGLAFTLGMGASVAIQMHAIPFLMDRGLSRVEASGIWGFLALWGVIGKVGLGALANRFSGRMIFTASLVVQALSVVLVFLSPTRAAAWGFAMLFGLGMGGQNCTRATIVAEYYGVRAYGAIWGMLTLFALPGQVGGGPLAGYLRDATQNYHLPFLIFVGAFVCGGVALQFLRRPKALA